MFHNTTFTSRTGCPTTLKVFMMMYGIKMAISTEIAMFSSSYFLNGDHTTTFLESFLEMYDNNAHVTLFSITSIVA